MKKTYLLIVITSGIVSVICGCGGPGDAVNTGFLSDYSKVELVADSSYRYLDQSVFGNYKGFIIDPVAVRFYPGSKAKESQGKGELTQQDIDDLANYFHSAIIEKIKESGYKIEYRPGQGVARIRIAITDAEKTNVALAAVPSTRVVSGVGVGGAAMEAELLDSVTGKQIGAVVEAKAGSRVPFTGLSDWGGAKSAMDAWADRFKQRLEETKSK